MQTLFVKKNGSLVYTPSKSEWFGMHWELQTLVKETGGMIDIPNKFPTLKKYNEGRVDQKKSLL